MDSSSGCSLTIRDEKRRAGDNSGGAFVVSAVSMTPSRSRLRTLRPLPWVAPLLGAMCLLLPGASAASPPPEVVPATVALLPTLAAMALLALAGVACGLLRARQRPGRLFLAASLVGATALAAGALGIDPPFDIRHWSAALQLEATVLAAISLAAWVWGRGPERGVVRGAIAGFAATALLAAGLWAGALAHVARVPFVRGDDVPPECGEPRTWSPPAQLESPDRWLDYRVASRNLHGQPELVAAALRYDGSGVELMALREGPSGLTQLASNSLAIDGEWIGLAGDRDGRVYAAWSSADRRSVTIARIGAHLEVLQARTWPAPRQGARPELSAGARACLDTSSWVPGGVRHQVLVVDASLRPSARRRAALSAMGGGGTLAGAITLPASLLLCGWVAAHGWRLRRLARAPRWQGRLAADGVTLEAEDGARVRVEAPPPVRGGWAEGRTYTVVGRGGSAPAGGPYREAAVVVRAKWAAEGTWSAVLDRRRGHLGRIALLAAAVTAALSVSALELLVLG
jgi:hypothetical protein